MSTIQEEKQVDELALLRQEVYQALMSIGANVAAEKVIMNDLSTDSDFDMGWRICCVVGWAHGGPKKVNNLDVYTKAMLDPHAGCQLCVGYSDRLYHLQVKSLYTPNIVFNPIPTKEFLNETLDFVKHFKGEHQRT